MDAAIQESTGQIVETEKAPRILFVDDETSITRSLKRMVRSYSIEAEIETANSATEALERIAQGDIDVVVSDIWMPGMDGIELLTRLKANSETQQIPVIMLTGDGDTSVKNVALELGAAEFINKPPDPTDLCARLRNVMRLKSYQDKLVEQMNALSIQIIRAQKMEIAGIMASQAAHDLNNLLHAIVGKAEVVLHKTCDCEVQPDIERMIEAARHASSLVSQIRDLGRRNPDEVHSCDPCSVIEESLELLQVMIPDRITVNWDNPRLSVFAGIDASALNQVILNLVINALHAMDDTGTMTLRIKTRTMDYGEAAEKSLNQGEYLVVSVSDTGCGIDEDILPHIFSPFFTTKDQGEGTGIGLSVVDRIVKGVSGKVNVTSGKGQGTTFEVYLPVSGD